jgi:hypothetical protein
VINQLFLLVVMVGIGPGNTPLFVPHSEHRSLPACMAAAQLPEVKKNRALACVAMPPRATPIFFALGARQ